MKKYVIIVAGGKGKRMDSEIPKQFIRIEKFPVLMLTINRFYLYDNNITFIVGLPYNQHEFWKKLCNEFDFRIDHQIVEGGETRFHTVKNCLKHIKDHSLVAVHDGVRPFVSTKTIQRCFDLAEKKGTAIPVLSLTESIRLVKGEESKALNREEYKTIQTPEVFRSDIILQSYDTGYLSSFTDDASVIEKAGYKIYMTEGNIENIKITTPNDLKIARCYIS